MITAGHEEARPRSSHREATREEAARPHAARRDARLHTLRRETPDHEPARLLVIEDDIPLTGSIKDLLDGTNFETKMVFSVEQAEAVMKDHHFDLILLDISLPGEDGLTFYRRRKDSLPPTLLMSAVNRSVVYSGEIPLTHFLAKPFTPDELLRRLHYILNSEVPEMHTVVEKEIAMTPVPTDAAEAVHAGADHVLLVEDDPILSELLDELLVSEGYRVTRAGTIAGARERLSTDPGIFILDGVLPDGDGLSFMDELRSNPRFADRPIIILSGRSNSRDKAAGLMTGADDYLAKPFETDELIARVHALLRRASALNDSSPLTGLPGNRRIQHEIELRLSRGENFEALYADIDHFKTFNDRYGFAAGDKAILLLADCLKAETSAGDFVGHIGGDDFIVVYETGAGEARSRRALDEFAKRARMLHNEEERQAGVYKSRDRQGTPVEEPLLCATGGLISTRQRRVGSYAELSQVAAELKSAARHSHERVYTERRTA